MAPLSLRLFSRALLLWAALCRADRREQELGRLLAESDTMEDHAGVAAAASMGKLVANDSAVLAAEGQATRAASFSAGAAASSVARSAANSSAVLVVNTSIKARANQGNQSMHVAASSLTAATVQAHEALAHAAAALAEQQAHNRQKGENSDETHAAASKEDPSGGADNASASPEQKEEEKLEKEEESTLGGGITSLTKAFSDPRGFLLDQPTIKTFAQGVKAAVEMSPNKGKCLASGEFAGYGCGDDKDFPKICSCAGLFELCWLPEDPQTIAKKFPTNPKAALDDAKALLFGKCYKSYALMGGASAAGVVVLLVLAWVAKSKLSKRS